MRRERPPLVIVSGAPGSGKTTLAEALAEDLRLPLIARDELKERLADALLSDAPNARRPVESADSTTLGRAAYGLLIRRASRAAPW